MPEIEAGIRLTARNETSAAFNQFGRDARAAASVAREQFDLVSKQLGITGAALTAVGAAGAALIVKSTLLAARVETLGIVMRTVGRNAGYTAEQMDGFEESVRAMGITTQASRQSLIRLAQANIDLADANKIARIAQDAAVIGGINSSEAFERLVHGMTTRQPEILRTIGILVNFEQAMNSFAEENDRTVDSLSNFEKQQIAANAVMAAGERIFGSYEAAMTSAGKAMTSLPRFAEEAELAFGQVFLPTLGAVVAMATDALKAFNALNPELQQTAALSVAAGTAIAGLVGPLLILASRLPGIAGGLANVGSVFFSLGPNIRALGTNAGFATTALAGMAPAIGALLTAAVAATAVTALAIALGTLAKFAIDVNARVKDLRQTFQDHQQAVFETSATYQDFEAEMRRVQAEMNRHAAITRTVVMSQEEFNNLTLAGKQVVRAYGSAVTFMSAEEFKLSKALEASYEGVDRLRTSMEAGTRTEEDFTAASEKAATALEERLNRQLEDLAFVMSVDLEGAFSDHEDRVRELTDTQADLIAQISELESKRWLTSAQKGELDELKRALLETNGALVDEASAWEKNTAQLIFNMAQRALSQAPIEVQAAALGSLAQELGLIDEAGGRAFTQIVTWSQMLADKKITLEEYLALVQGLRSNLDGLRSKTIDVRVNYIQTGSSQFLPTGVRAQQHGGPLGAGWNLVGEAGAELITPWGEVLNASATRRMMASKRFQPRKLQGGGFAFDPDTLRQAGYQNPEYMSFTQQRQATTSIVQTARGEAGGGGAGLTATAVTVERAVSEVGTAIGQEAALAIGAAAAGLGSEILGVTQQQTDQLRAIIRDQQGATTEMLIVLRDIARILEGQGTAFDMAQAVQEGLQTAVGD